jgi:hypothetical protein
MRCPVRHVAFDFGISLNSMSYQVLSLIVMANAFVTFWLILAGRQTDVIKANKPARLNKKAAKLLWQSDPIVPQHNPPKIDVSKFSGVCARSEREFFRDFEQFADVINSALTKSHDNAPSRFRLEDTPEDEVGLIVRTTSPTRGRCFRLYYNQYPIGRIEVQPWLDDYTTETPHVWTDVEIDMARYLRYHELTQFLRTIAGHVTNFNPRHPRSDYPEARLTIEAALTEALWGSYENSRGRYDWPETEDRGRLLVGLLGQAEWYIARRADRLRTATKSMADA